MDKAETKQCSLLSEGAPATSAHIPLVVSHLATSNCKEGWEMDSKRAVMCPAHSIVLEVVECYGLNVPPKFTG